MKNRSTSRLSVKAKVSSTRYIVVGVSLSIVAILVCMAFFYFRNNEEARAEVSHRTTHSKGPKGNKPHSLFELFRNIKLIEKNRAASCKPKSGYKKEKASGIASRKKSRTPYKYVYHSASAAPPRTMVASNSKATSPVAGNPESNNNSEELVASLSPSIPSVSTPSILIPAYSWSKNMTSEQRKEAVKTMPPTKVLPPIRFISNQDEFSVVNMDSFMEALEMINQGKMVLIEGHTDDLGSSMYNLSLSMKRVEKIRQLMLQAGASDNLISVVGYGEEKPLVPNTNAENRQINRRIEFKIFDL